jgi:hypothetical protein
MKVRDLKAILARANDDDEVVIPAHVVFEGGKESGGVGTISHAKVSRANNGFDWERGMFLVWPDRQLRYDHEKKGKNVSS